MEVERERVDSENGHKSKKNEEEQEKLSHHDPNDDGDHLT